MQNLGSCSLRGRCKDGNTGKLTNKTSLLHNDLLELGKFSEGWSRTDSWTTLGLALSDKFLAENEDKLLFDSNGEPTAVSLWETAAGISPLRKITHKEIRNFLAKKFDEGYYPYEEALQKATNFTSTKLGSKSFIGVVTYDSEAKQFKFEIQPNTVENQNKFAQLIRDVELYKIIRSLLERAGIDIDLLAPEDILNNEDSNIKGLYVVRQLQAFIKLEDNTFDLATISNEAAHAMVSAMKGTPILERFENYLKLHLDRIGIAVLGEAEYRALLIVTSANPETQFREIEDRILAEMLRQRTSKIVEEQEKNELVGVFLNLVSKLWLGFKNFIHRVVKRSSYADATRLANSYAKKIIDNFLSPDFEISKENLLQENGTRLHTDITSLHSTASNILAHLYLLERLLAAIGEDTSRLQKDLKTWSELVGTYKSVSATDIESILKLLDGIIVTFLENIDNIVAGNKLNDLAFIDREDWTQTASTIRTYYKSLDIIEALQSKYPSKDAEHGTVSYNIAQKLLEYHDKLATKKQNVENLTSNLILSFSLEVVGAPAFYAPQFRDWGKKAFKEGALDEHGRRSAISISDYLSNADLGLMAWPERFLLSMSSHPYIINLILDRIIQDLKFQADLKSDEILGRLRDLALWAESSTDGGRITNFKKFFELGPEGYTGYFITKYDKNKYLKELREFKKTWLAARIGDYENKTPEQIKGILNSNPELRKQLNRAVFNWQKLEVNGVPRCVIELDLENVITNITPSEQVYPNPVYTALTAKEKLCLEKFMDIKRSLDRCLPSNTMPEYLAPQYLNDWIEALESTLSLKYAKIRGARLIGRYGGPMLAIGSVAWGVASGSITPILAAVGIRLISLRFLSKFWNKEMLTHPNKNLNKLIGKALEESGGIIADAFLDDPVLDGIYNNSEVSNQLNIIRHLPIPGVKKLLHPDEICTDPFKLLMAHAHVCISYSCMQNCVGLCEIAKDHVRDKKGVGGFRNSSHDVAHDMEIHLDKQAYRLQSFLIGDSWAKQKNRFWWWAFAKISQGLANACSVFYLGANMVSASINVFTAIAETFKTAMVGESFNFALWAEGLAEYGVCMAKSFVGGINFNSKTPFRLDRLSLISRRLGMKGARNWNNLSLTKRFRFLTDSMGITDIALAPYSLTDGLMQSVGFIATLKNIELVKLDADGNVAKDEKGKEIRTSLWKAYKIGNSVDRSSIPLLFRKFYKFNGVEWVLQEDILGEKYTFTEDENAKAVVVDEKLVMNTEGLVVDRRIKPVTLPKVLTSSKAYKEVYLDSDWYISDPNLLLASLKKIVRPEVTRERYDNDGKLVWAYYENVNNPEGSLGALYANIMNEKGESCIVVTAITTPEIPFELENCTTQQAIKEALQLGNYACYSAGTLPEKYLVVYAPKDGGEYMSDRDRYGYVPFDSSLESRVAQDINRLNSKMHGLYSSMSQGRLAASMIGPFLLNMKKWAIGLYETGFRPTTYDMYKAEFREGYSITLAKYAYDALVKLVYIFYHPKECDPFGEKRTYIKNSWNNLMSFIEFTLGGTLGVVTTTFAGSPKNPRYRKSNSGRFGELIQKAISPLTEEGYSQHQIANLRRTQISMLLIGWLCEMLKDFSPGLPLPIPPPPDEKDFAIGKNDKNYKTFIRNKYDRLKELHAKIIELYKKDTIDEEIFDLIDLYGKVSAMEKYKYNKTRGRLNEEKYEKFRKMYYTSLKDYTRAYEEYLNQIDPTDPTTFKPTVGKNKLGALYVETDPVTGQKTLAKTPRIARKGLARILDYINWLPEKVIEGASKFILMASSPVQTVKWASEGFPGSINQYLARQEYNGIMVAKGIASLGLSNKDAEDLIKEVERQKYIADNNVNGVQYFEVIGPHENDKPVKLLDPREKYFIDPNVAMTELLYNNTAASYYLTSRIFGEQKENVGVAGLLSSAVGWGNVSQWFVGVSLLVPDISLPTGLIASIWNMVDDYDAFYTEKGMFDRDAEGNVVHKNVEYEWVDENHKKHKGTKSLPVATTAYLESLYKSPGSITVGTPKVFRRVAANTPADRSKVHMIEGYGAARARMRALQKSIAMEKDIKGGFNNVLDTIHTRDAYNEDGHMIHVLESVRENDTPADEFEFPGLNLGYSRALDL